MLNSEGITGEDPVSYRRGKLVSDKYYRRNASDTRGGPNAGN